MNLITTIIFFLLISLFILMYLKMYRSEKQINKRNNLTNKQLRNRKIYRYISISILIIFSPILFNFIKYNLPYIDALYKPSEIVYQMYIDVEIDIDDFTREDYVKGNVTIKQYDEVIHNNLSMEMRGRGNTNWTKMDKKSYRINFINRESLLGMKSARDYVILAEHADQSLLRTYGAHSLSFYLNVGYTIETRFLDVYINGEYNGFYLLAEQVEIDKNRLNINCTIDPNSGYLVEYEVLDRLDPNFIEGYDYFIVNGQYFVLKDFNYSSYTEEEVRLKISSVKNDVQIMVDSFSNGTYHKYINVESFIDYFILQELYKELDVYRLSIFFYKGDDGLIYMGPCWDFDLSSGVCQSISLPMGIYAEKNAWFGQLMKSTSFKEKYIKRFNFIYEYVLDDFFNHMIEVQKLTINSREKNFYNWRVMFIRVWPNSFQTTILTSVNQQDTYYNWFITTRSKWLYKYYNK